MVKSMHLAFINAIIVLPLWPRFHWYLCCEGAKLLAGCLKCPGRLCVSEWRGEEDPASKLTLRLICAVNLMLHCTIEP